jgi:hypothetical protein
MKHTRLSSAPRLAPQRKLRDSPFGTLLIKQQLASNDEETVEQIRGNSCMQFIWVLQVTRARPIRPVDDGSFPQEIL